LHHCAITPHQTDRRKAPFAGWVRYARLGSYEASSVALIAIGLPLVVIGSWLGDRVIRSLDPRMFGWLVGGLILLSGVAPLVK
jgi:uncharacterized membrane protein YfcA